MPLPLRTRHWYTRAAIYVCLVAAFDSEYRTGHTLPAHGIHTHVYAGLRYTLTAGIRARYRVLVTAPRLPATVHRIHTILRLRTVYTVFVRYRLPVTYLPVAARRTARPAR